jgi:hypothetical protein
MAASVIRSTPEKKVPRASRRKLAERLEQIEVTEKELRQAELESQ